MEEEKNPKIENATFKQIKEYKIPKFLKPKKTIEIHDAYLTQLSTFDNEGKEYYLGKSNKEELKEVFTDKFMLTWLISAFLWMSTMLSAPWVSLASFVIFVAVTIYLFVKHKDKKYNVVVLDEK